MSGGGELELRALDGLEKGLVSAIGAVVVPVLMVIVAVVAATVVGSALML